jgi:hypothetical protein
MTTTPKWVIFTDLDHPIFLKGKQEPSREIASKMRNLILREGTGPLPWNEALLGILG